jgi:hypothetical protein
MQAKILIFGQLVKKFSAHMALAVRIVSQMSAAGASSQPVQSTQHLHNCSSKPHF